jgi:SAM-dependent methyltransferase
MSNNNVDNKVNIEQAPRFLETIKILRSIVTKQSRVVEIGASDATFKKYMSSKEWLAVDKYGNPDVKTDINGPVVRLPFDDNSIDVVICTEVLEHLTIGTPLVKEIGRILKKNGKAIISVPNIVSFKSRIKVLFGIIPGAAASGDCGHPLGGTGVLVEGHWVASHVVDFNAKRLKQYIERGGLEVAKHWRMPISLGFKTDRITIPSFLSPKTLSDFILFEVRKNCS